MARDRLQELRRALHSSDGAAMVTAVQEVGPEVCLQLAGELVLVAIGHRTAGAFELAHQVITAIRNRDWDGDRELADALRDAATGRTAPLPEFAVDLEEVADLLEGGPDTTGGRIDLTTGEVWPDFSISDAWSGKPDDLDLDDPDRWLPVWRRGSSAGYRDMADFAAAQDPRLGGMLQIALDGPGAFRRFKNVLSDWPEEREQWFAFSEGRRHGRARAWLADAGYRAVFRPLDPPAR